MNNAHFVKTFLSAAALSTVLIASPAFAGPATYLPGTVCQPITGATANCVEYTQYGVHNTCSTNITVECPLPITSNSPAPSAWFAQYFAYDRSTVDNVSCTIQKTDSSGNVTFQSTANTSGGGAGSAVQSQIFTLTSQSFDSWWRFRCSLPGNQTAGWFSHLTSITIASL